MIVYHGSNKEFDELKIDKSLVRWDSTESNEGLGIYFSTDINVAKSYGKYIYTIDINAQVQDFRLKSVCDNFLDSLGSVLYQVYGFNIGDYMDTVFLSDRLKCGHQSIWGISDEICLWLDSYEDWYIHNIAGIQDVKQTINTYLQNNLKVYMFEYQIPNIGVIKDLSIVKIIKREEINS